LLIGGCWDETEIKERAIVIGMGLDKIPGNDPILLTVQVINPRTLKNIGQNSGLSQEEKDHGTKGSVMCEVLGPLYLLSFIILFLLVLPFFHLDRLKPQLDQGIYPFLSGTPLILSFIGICIAMGWYSAICNRPENGLMDFWLNSPPSAWEL
jgi:hypothetical protein